MKKQIKSLLCGLCAAALALGCAGCGGSAGPEVPAKVTNIMVWTYYNGDQLESFTSLVNQFNETVGAQKGIKVSTESQGSVNDLETSVMDSAEGKVGAAAMPNIFSAYADAAGVRYEDLATMEGLTAAAEKYYNWTDAQTAAPDDGKALFGRDAMANYMLVGAQQLGDTIFAVKDGRMTVNFERDVARRLWDNYYVPFVRGWFAATGRFRSDDIKTGNVLAYVGSSSSATFFPARVTNDANESHEISLKTLPAPQFEGGEAVAVQQGAGMVVTAAKEEEVKASVEFLKWFVRAENNIAFSVGSGYLPVTRKANDMQEILASGLTLDDNMQQTLAVAVDTVNGNRLYTPHAFAGSNSARKVLEYGLSDLAAADRETVVQRIAEGQSAAEAEAEFLTDEYFEAWYQDICAKLAQYEG